MSEQIKSRSKYKRMVRKPARIAEKQKRAEAHHKYARISNTKARIVLDQIKGKNVSEALAILAYSPRYAAEIIEKVLKSAIANAEHNLEFDVEKLYVDEVVANQGPTLKRIRPRAQGRAYRINKRTAHISIYLKER
ncbi:MAG: 50S ribosomal protein L22 [Eubacteriales bacterium]|nr:50S ribosomal protein L22 [Eubacteriales bacterium]